MIKRDLENILDYWWLRSEYRYENYIVAYVDYYGNVDYSDYNFAYGAAPVFVI